MCGVRYVPAGADAAQDGAVPPRAGLRTVGAAGAGGPAVPVRVRRPPQPPRALPLLPHPLMRGFSGTAIGRAFKAVEGGR